jgi:predicted type IV restriction endonuclease
MFPISLPRFDVKLKGENEQTYIFDIIRKKYLVLTPEEWVRQHLVHLLINQYGYPKGMFRLEKGHQYNELTKRTDIMVYNADNQVILLAECKAHYEKINQKTLTQAMNYNLHYQSPLILISNGTQTFCFQKKDGRYIQLEDIPRFLKF